MCRSSLYAGMITETDGSASPLRTERARTRAAISAATGYATWVHVIAPNEPQKMAFATFIWASLVHMVRQRPTCQSFDHYPVKRSWSRATTILANPHGVRSPETYSRTISSALRRSFRVTPAQP